MNTKFQKIWKQINYHKPKKEVYLRKLLAFRRQLFSRKSSIVDTGID